MPWEKRGEEEEEEAAAKRKAKAKRAKEEGKSKGKRGSAGTKAAVKFYGLPEKKSGRQ